MNNKEILANAPEGATHYASDGYFRIRGTKYMRYLKSGKLTEKWLPADPVSLDHIRRIVELEAQVSDFMSIVSESDGVVGYYLNRNIATWEELLDSRIPKVKPEIIDKDQGEN